MTYEEKLDDVLDLALDHHARLVEDARERDRLLGRSGYVAPDIEVFLMESDPSGVLLKRHRERERRERERLN